MIDYNYEYKDMIDFFYSRKKTFGYKLLAWDKDSHSKKFKLPKNSVIKIKADAEGFELITPSGKIPQKFFKAWFDPKNPEHLITQTKVLSNEPLSCRIIDCITGKHTPKLISIEHNYIIDENRNILKVDNELNVISTGLSVQSEYRAYKMIICKNENEKYIVCNRETLEPVLNFEFDNPNINIDNIEIKSDKLCSTIINDKSNIFVLNTKKQLVKEIHGDKVFVNNIPFNHESLYLSSYDEKTKKTTTCEYNAKKESCDKEIELDGKLLACEKIENVPFFITKDENGKKGVLSDKNKVILPHEYDGIYKRYLSSGKHMPAFLVEKSGKKGLLHINGEQILPVEYDDMDLYYLKRQFKDSTRFPVVKNGLYGIADSNGNIIADFVYTHKDDISPYKTKDEPNKTKYGAKFQNPQTGETCFFAENGEFYHSDEIIKEEYTSQNIAPQNNNEEQYSSVVKKYSDYEIAAASIAATLITGNVFMGMAVQDWMEDENN